MRLLTTFESSRAAISSSEANFPYASRSAIAVAIAASPQFLIAANP